MWLRNYYNILTSMLLGDKPVTTESTDQPSDYTPPIVIRNTGGSWKNSVYTENAGTTYIERCKSILYIGKGPAQLITSMTGSGVVVDNNNFGICLGTGSTPVSYDDYKLDNIVSSFSLQSSTGNLTTPSTLEGENYKSVREYRVSNSGGSTLNIKEIGLTKTFSGSDYSFLVYREVLDEAIVMEPGDTIILSFNRNARIFNYTPY